MEFKFDIKDLVDGGIVKIDHTLIPFGYENDEKYICSKHYLFINKCIFIHGKLLNLIHTFYSLQRRIAMIIDEMGKASARAQDLKMPITTSEKLSKSDHTVYLLSEQTDEEYLIII